MWKIIHLVIKSFGIQLVVSLVTLNIDDVAYEVVFVG
jgi:hypothetical protein